MTRLLDVGERALHTSRGRCLWEGEVKESSPSRTGPGRGCPAPALSQGASAGRTDPVSGDPVLTGTRPHPPAEACPSLPRILAVTSSRHVSLRLRINSPWYRWLQNSGPGLSWSEI